MQGPAAPNSKVQPSQRTEILVKALSRARSDAVRPLATVLRNWASQGKAYKGHVFSVEEVEAALASLPQGSLVGAEGDARGSSSDAPASQTETPTPEEDGSSRRLVTITADPQMKLESPAVFAVGWPPPKLRQALMEISKRLDGGKVGLSESTFSAASCSILQTMHQLCCEEDPHDGSDPLPSDVNIATQEGTVRAHRCVLEATCYFFERAASDDFRRPSETSDASSFPRNVVQAAVEFAYFGKCRLPLDDVGTLHALGDFWVSSALLQAVSRRVAVMPPLCCLRVLADWTKDMPSAALARTITERAAAGFSRAAQSLPGTQETAIEFAVMLSQHMKFVADSGYERLQAWLEEEPLRGAVMTYMVSSLRSFSSTRLATATHDQFTKERGKAAPPAGPKLEIGLIDALCGYEMRCLLPAELLREIARTLCQEEGVLNQELGDVQPWVQWAYAGSQPSFANIRLLYDIVQEHRDSFGRAVMSLPASAQLRVTNVEVMLRTSEAGFSQGFVEALHLRNEADAWQTQISAGRRAWEGMVVHADTYSAAVKESFDLVVSLLRRGVGSALAPEFSAKLVVQLVQAATHDLAPQAVRVMNGPEAVCGVYWKSRTEDFVFTRVGEEDQKLVMRWMRRQKGVHEGTSGIRMDWSGLPMFQLRTIKGEWKIQRPGDDPEVDCPRAVLLSEVTNPGKLPMHWWVRGASDHFVAVSTMRVATEAVAAKDLSSCLAAVLHWSQGSLERLANLRSAASRDNASAPTKQVCSMAEARLRRQADGPPPQSQQEEIRKRWQAALAAAEARKPAQQTAQNEGGQCTQGQKRPFHEVDKAN
mmetsp:Transcript_35364/g.82676  ORF Transcript_35364/g.82676 Transcript_35364/m.82676 type:complete len:822 (+) Transcript_35364:103-2568(+)